MRHDVETLTHLREMKRKLLTLCTFGKFLLFYQKKITSRNHKLLDEAFYKALFFILYQITLALLTSRSKQIAKKK